MKRWFVIALTSTVVFSCQKEVIQNNSSSNPSNAFSFTSMFNALQDSLISSDFEDMDTTRWYKSPDPKCGGLFVRIGLHNKAFTSDFVLLRVDSLGHINEGKIIHIDKELNASNDSSFNGRFIISSLRRETIINRQIKDNKLIVKNRLTVTAMVEEQPAGEQELPDVVVTSYNYSGVETGDWYWYGAFFDYGSSDSYTYGYSGGGGSSSGVSPHDDRVIEIEVEATDNSAININDYLKCFTSVPDAGATYQITLLSDIPVNGAPSELFNYTTGEIGHSFIQLRKTSGSVSVQQNIGFYPNTGWKSLSTMPVASKIEDNAGHEFNASLTASLNSNEFQSAIKEIQTVAGRNYEITRWNCTDFALAVFNASNTGETLTIPKFPIPGTDTYSNTPQGLYVTLQQMKEAGNDSYGNIDVPGVCGYIGGSHGSCGN